MDKEEKIFQNSEIIIYGNKKQMMDLKYVFEELNICMFTECDNTLVNYIKQGFFAVLCKKEKAGILALLEKEKIQKKDHFCWDGELIDMLNFSLEDKSINKKVVVWGIGQACQHFEEIIVKRSMDNIVITGYVDNDLTYHGQLRNGVPVLAPTDITPEEHYVIVATSYENFVDIKSDLQKKGFKEDGYVHYRTVIDDVASFFKKTYECEYYYDVECINKDSSVRLGGNGDVCTCCMAQESILGNCFDNTFEEVWKSKRAEITRLALENRTYVNCDKSRCPFLSNIKPESIYSEKYDELLYKKWHGEYPDSIAPEVDRSCNLYCSSCRKEIFIDKSQYIECYADMVLDKIVPLPTRLIINTVGELFASKACLRILHDKRTCKKKNISIYSNGTLIFPNVLDDLLCKYETIEISISIDAATEETYKKIRRNGNFKKLCENLEYISKQRKKGRVTFFQVNYVLQADNIAEMEQFVLWTKELGVDRIAINAIEKWDVFDEEEFEKVSVLRMGDIKEEYKKYFTKDLINDDVINFFNLANYIGATPKRMYMV